MTITKPISRAGRALFLADKQIMETKEAIILGQKVNPVNVQRAKEFRRKMTKQERKLWNGLRNNQLGYHFRRQQVIAGFIIDFYCNSLRLVIEVDG